MQTYRLCCAFLALFLITCTKPKDNQEGIEQESVDANYSVLLTKNGNLDNVLLNASLEVLTRNPSESNFVELENPLLHYKDGFSYGFYTKTANCGRRVTLYNAEIDSYDSFPVFTADMNCEQETKAIAYSEGTLYLAYQLPDVFEQRSFFLRIVDLENNSLNTPDVPMECRPQHMVVSQNRLFILVLDENEGKNKLMVLDTDRNEFIHEMEMGPNVQKITKHSDGNILVAYADLHTILDTNTLVNISTVRYNEGIEPKFGLSNLVHYDIDGKMYYAKPMVTNNRLDDIPAIYDFTSNTNTLYIYDRFLTEE
ncbi:hypothetical protein [Costertonia aggregata]|uniref:Uncharacterized protein n=1 Tax=Costertonia aggregata TaxID=343403 RepID=A0A7H9AJS3_9FLAO|nr:hypothetical protein [Costertonia aggregata]QLG43810.1 hypothetical protein HYG79_00070 [Costertonia aggregata]